MINLNDLLTKERTLFAPALDSNHKLHRLLDSALHHLTTSQVQTQKQNHYWDAKAQGLEQTTLYSKLSEEQKLKLLSILTDYRLELAWYIEKTGMNFCGKMILLSDTYHEKSIYGLMAYDETVHQRDIEHFLKSYPQKNLIIQHPLLNCLNQGIQASKETSVFVLQVLLEGFGMSYYGQLRDTCCDDEFKKVMDRILKDEARHHGSGVVLFETAKLNQFIKDEIFETTMEFIKALHGIGWILPAFAEATGYDLTKSEKELLLNEMNWNAGLQNRLKKMKEMIAQSDRMDLISRLEKQNAFDPGYFPTF
jgi:hypothetical protein